MVYCFDTFPLLNSLFLCLGKTLKVKYSRTTYKTPTKKLNAIILFSIEKLNKVIDKLDKFMMAKLHVRNSRVVNARTISAVKIYRL